VQDCLDDGFQSTGCQQYLANIAKLAQGSFGITTCLLNQQVSGLMVTDGPNTLFVLYTDTQSPLAVCNLQK